MGVLTIGLNNKNYPDFNDVLLINDFGRRIYPQFISEPESDDPGDSLRKVKNCFFCDAVKLNLFTNTVDKKTSTSDTDYFTADLFKPEKYEYSTSRNTKETKNEKKIKQKFHLLNILTKSLENISINGIKSLCHLNTSL